VVNQVLNGQRSFGHIVALVFAFVAIMSIRGFSVPIIGCVFVLSAPVRYCVQRVLHRHEAQEPIF